MRLPYILGGPVTSRTSNVKKLKKKGQAQTSEDWSRGYLGEISRYLISI